MGQGVKRDAARGARPVAGAAGGGRHPAGRPARIIGLIAVGVVVVLLLVVRQGLRPEECTLQPVAAPRPAPRPAAAPRAALNQASGGDDDRQAAVAQRREARVARHAAAPQPPAPGAAGGAEPAAEKPAQTQGASTLRGDLAQAVATAINFAGSTQTADATFPLISEAVGLDSDGVASFPPHAALAYPDSGGINLDGGSLGFWVRMDWDPSRAEIEGKRLAELSTTRVENRFEVNMGTHFVSFYLTNNEGVEQGVVAAVPWSPGVWHHVATTWGDGLMQIYVDGSFVDAHSYSGSILLPPETPLYVASRKSGSERQGTVSVRAWHVFKRAISGDEIAELVVQTAP